MVKEKGIFTFISPTEQGKEGYLRLRRTVFHFYHSLNLGSKEKENNILSLTPKTLPLRKRYS